MKTKTIIQLPISSTLEQIRDAYDKEKNNIVYFNIGNRYLRAERKYTYHKGSRVIKTQYLNIIWCSDHSDNADLYKSYKEQKGGSFIETTYPTYNKWIREQRKVSK